MSTAPTSLQLHAHSPTGDLWPVTISSTSPVAVLKEQLTRTHNLHGRALRIIHRGRVLEEQRTLQSYAVASGDHIHVSIANLQPPPASLERSVLDDPSHPLHFLQGSNTRGGDPNAPTLAERLFGPQPSMQPGTNNPALRVPRGVQSAQPVRPRGFERLRQLGYGEVQINQIRMQFQARQFRENMIPESEEHLRAMEDEWVETYLETAQDDLEAAREPEAIARIQEHNHIIAEGTNRDMFFGMCIGFVFGILAIPFLAESFVNRRQKIGIMAGLGCNISFGILRIILRH